MLLLVFFLSHVDDSHDKVLKLAPLKQLLANVNLYLPVELHGVFVFSKTPRYDSRGFVVLKSAYLWQHSLHMQFYQSSCSCMFMLMTVCGNIICEFIRE